MKNPFFLVMLIVILPAVVFSMPIFVATTVIGGIYMLIHGWYKVLSTSHH
jgi:hypothetical protein